MKVFAVFMMSMLLPWPVNAMSKLYESDGQVVIVRGTPCFFAEVLAQHPNWKGFSIVVRERQNSGSRHVIWSMVTQPSSAVSKPLSKETCVQYGGNWPLGMIDKGPATLRDNVQYEMILEAPDDRRSGGEFVNRHGARFCLSRSKDDGPLLVEWGGGAIGCSEEPLNPEDKPSLWGGIFGKK